MARDRHTRRRDCPHLLAGRRGSCLRPPPGSADRCVRLGAGGCVPLLGATPCSLPRHGRRSARGGEDLASRSRATAGSAPARVLFLPWGGFWGVRLTVHDLGAASVALDRGEGGGLAVRVVDAADEGV